MYFPGRFAKTQVAHISSGCRHDFACWGGSHPHPHHRPLALSESEEAYGGRLEPLRQDEREVSIRHPHWGV